MPRRTAGGEDDLAGEVEHDGRDVVDVQLQAEGDEALAAQRHRTARSAAGAGPRALLGDRAGRLEVGDDDADRGLGQAGVLGQLGPGGRAEPAQGAEHRCGVVPPQALGADGRCGLTGQRTP